MVSAEPSRPENFLVSTFRSTSSDHDRSDAAQVVSPVLDSTGNIDTWPEGFFDQFDKDMKPFLPDGSRNLDFIVNDLSFHGQFFDITTFLQSLGRILRMRTIAQSYGRENVLSQEKSRQLTSCRNMSLQQAIQRLSQDKRRSIMGWLTKYGPFWEEERRHSQDEYLECKGELVTNTVVGEAAYCCPEP